MSSAQPQGAQWQPTNTAQGNSRVQSQIGVVNGSATFHQYNYTYKYNPDDGPAQKYQLALRNLDGGMPRLAEKLLGQVIVSSAASTEIAYYYAIAILSERTSNQLGQEEFYNLDVAIRTARRFPQDQWTTAIDVVAELLSCVRRQVTEDEPAVELLAEAIDTFERLPENRRAEVYRHLDMILDGAIQDELDRVNAGVVAQGRTAGHRERRVWMFFEPDPAAPRTSDPYFSLRARSRDWLTGVLGMVGFATAVVFARSLTSPADPAAVVLWIVLILAGAAIVVGAGAVVVAGQLRRRQLAFEHGDGSQRPDGAPDPDRFGPFGFRPAIEELIGARFTDVQPGSDVPTERQVTWWSDVAGFQRALATRLVRTYGRWIVAQDGRHNWIDVANEWTRRPTDVQPVTLNWLIRWHAEQVAQGWRTRTLPDIRRHTAAEWMAEIVRVLGVLVAVGGCLGLYGAIAGTISESDTLYVLAVAALGVAATGGTAVLGQRRSLAWERKNNRLLYEQELAAYQAWCGVLAARPNDAEMERWLDFDKAHLKITAMRKAGLTNRDMIGHIVLTQGGENAKRARVLYGPVRYSSYVVLVFLLTENGVREMEIDLDFETGAVHDERRMSFRYDALASARVQEVGVQFTGGRRRVLVTSEHGSHVTNETTSLVLSRALMLWLNNRQMISVLVDNFQGLLDSTVENQSQLMDGALDTSGVTSALRILEAVAAEGRDWIAKERERHDRRWQDSRRGDMGRQALGDGRRASQLGFQPVALDAAPPAEPHDIVTAEIVEPDDT